MANRTALSLMRMALGLYDRDGEGRTDAADHLRTAIDAAARADREQTGRSNKPRVLAKLDIREEAEVR